VNSLYVDTGALLKLYVEEPLTAEVHGYAAAARHLRHGGFHSLACFHAQQAGRRRCREGLSRE